MKTPLPVSREMIAELCGSDAYTEFMKFAEHAEASFAGDEDNIARAIQAVAEDRFAAGDAIENLLDGRSGEENAAMLLHGDPVAAQALLRKHFIRAAAKRVMAKLTEDCAKDIERSLEEKAEYEAESRADALLSRFAA